VAAAEAKAAAATSATTEATTAHREKISVQIRD